MVRVALVTNGSSATPRAWSGTPFFARREVERRFPGTTAVLDTPRADAAVRRVSAVLRRLRIGLDLDREPLVTRAYGLHVARAVRRAGAEVVVSVGASHKLADAPLGVPVVHVSDALFDTITRYYDRYAALSPRSRRLGSAVQRRLLSRTAVVLLASDWAAEDARRRYDLSGTEVVVAPLGANLPDEPAPRDPPPRDALGLLFVGYDWQRKGGPLAVQVLAELVAAGVPATLTVVGCTPAGLPDDLPVRCVGRLDKATAAGARALAEHLSAASFLLVPSSREAFGLVFAEAAAHSRPSIALRTGGVPTAVEDGRSGLLFDEGASAAEIAAAVRDVWRDEAAHLALCRGAREHYEERLTWTAWGAALEAAVARAVEGRGSGG